MWQHFIPLFCIVEAVRIITYTLNLGKMPGFIICRSFIRVSNRMGAELDRKSLPHVTAAMSVRHDYNECVKDAIVCN